jgi:site-specific DNA recombinase
VVGDIKKERYVYYRCSGYKGKCPEPYVREEVLVDRFAELLDGMALEPEVIDWISQALKESHQDEKRFHDDAISA